MKERVLQYVVLYYVYECRTISLFKHSSFRSEPLTSRQRLPRRDREITTPMTMSDFQFNFILQYTVSSW